MANTEPVFPWDRVASVPDYEVFDADLEHACDDAVAVWGNTIGWPGRQEAMYRRYYLECPTGKPDMYFLRHRPSGRNVGTLGIGPRRVFWRGREIRAGALSHFCVTRQHRKLRPPMLLVKKAADACRGRYDALYAMPGTAQAAALGKLFGGAPACFMSRRVKVLRPGKYFEHLLPRPLAAVAGGAAGFALRFRDGLRGGAQGLIAEWSGRVDPRMAKLWRDSPRGEGWNALRETDFLQWRLDGLPSRKRRYLLVRAGTGDPLLAWFACDTNYFDADILVVQDYWATGGPEALDHATIHALCNAVRQLGFAAVEVRVAAPDTTIAPWTRAGFVERNRFPIFVAWLDLSLAPGAGAAFHITDIDNDG